MLYFGRKEDGKVKIYELDIINEEKSFYEVQLKGTNSGRLLFKDKKDKLQIDGIYSDKKKIIKDALKEVG